MKKLLVFVALCGMLATLGMGTAYGESRELQPLLARPRELTQAEYRAAVVMTVGDTVALKLGEAPPEWEVTVTDEAVLSRVIGITVVRGAQGVWEAKAPGTATVRAVGWFPCQRHVPQCKIASPVWEATVLVQPRPDKAGQFQIGSGQVFLENSRTYVPGATLAAALGATYAEHDGQAVLKAGGAAVTLQAGSRELSVGPATVLMDVAPIQRDGVLYLPMRWTAEALGYHVGWDAVSWTATFAGE